MTIAGNNVLDEYKLRDVGYGTVIVRGTGGSFNPLAYVSAPLALRRAVRLGSGQPAA
jgi:hypothetical protein